MTAPAYGQKATSFDGLPEFSKKRGWFIVIGLLLLFAGIFSIYLAAYTTLFTVALLGGLVLAGGVLCLLHSVLSTQWQGFLLNLLLGILYIGLGALLISNPGIAAMSLTLMIAFFLIVSGLFRIAVAAATRVEHWGWFIFSGLVSVLLGAFVWSQWPVSGLLIIGIYVGVELIMTGSTLLALAVATRKMKHAMSS